MNRTRWRLWSLVGLLVLLVAGLGVVYLRPDWFAMFDEPTPVKLNASAWKNYSQIEEGLYLGGYIAEPPPGTRAVLNLCQDEDPYTAEVHRWKPIPDAAPAPSLDWLRQQVEFVDAQRRAGRPVYVHCHAGISRGGMVVVAYLMAHHQWTRDEALCFVRTQRPVVSPNAVFMDLLRKWEAEVSKR